MDAPKLKLGHSNREWRVRVWICFEFGLRVLGVEGFGVEDLSNFRAFGSFGTMLFSVLELRRVWRFGVTDG